MNHAARSHAPADLCIPANRTYGLCHDVRGTAVAHHGAAEVSMVMFKRSQLYIGFALAALAEIIVRAMAH